MLHSDTLEKKKYFNYDLICTEFTIYSAANQFDQSNPFLFAQSFADRIKLWWPTDIGFEEYLKAVDTFFQSQKLMTQNLDGIQQTDSSSDQHVWDIYLYLKNYNVEHLQIKNSSIMNINPIEDYRKVDGPIRLLRIAMPCIDFYYDMEPHENGIRRAGIVTNLTHDDMIFDYMALTHAKLSDKDTVKQFVREIVSCMNEW